MPILAANCTKETQKLIQEGFDDDEFHKFRLQNNLKLDDMTILIRLALINLKKTLPSNEEVSTYKVALLKPDEFDDFWRKGGV